MNRVVVTGLGVVAPNGVGVPAFLHALRHGVSGIRYVPEYEQLGYNCLVSGLPDFQQEELRSYLPEVIFHGFNGKAIGYAVKAALDAWTDAGNEIDTDEARWETGCVFGNSATDAGIMKTVIARVDSKEARKLGSRVIEQTMNSGPTAYISGRLGLGNKVITNSAACATGSQSVLMGYEYIKHNMARRMLVGSTEHLDPYMFGSFDAMRILSRKFNHAPAQASRPMSASAGGFVPGSGAAALVLEDLDFALARGATIYAEILGGACNSGGQKSGGSMTAPNPSGVHRCITDALADAGISGESIDLISGHLTATAADRLEVQNWATALNRSPENFPMINSTKSMIGHCLSAAGSIELAGVVLQLKHQFVHPNVNLEDPNPEITHLVGSSNLPTSAVDKELNIVAKANFGFGDVNTCLILSKYTQ